MTNKASGRVTTRELYGALIDQTKAMGEMEIRIIDRINIGISSQRDNQQQVEARLAAGAVHFENLEKDVDNLKLWDKGIGILALIGTAIASAIGINK